MKQFNVILKNRSGNTDIVKNSNIELLGAVFQLASDSELAELRISHGIKITKIKDGILKEAGIRNGFIVLYIDKEEVKSIDELRFTLNRKNGGTLFEGIYPNGQRAYYGVGL